MPACRCRIRLVCSLILGLSLAACQAAAGPPGQPSPTANTALERIIRKGVVRVGYADEKPFAYTGPDGAPAGASPAIAWVILQNLGIRRVEGVVAEFSSLIPRLQAGRFDVLATGMYIRPERCEQVLFANPELKIGAGLLVRAGNPLNLHRYEDIAANPAARVGTGAGYFEADYLIALGVQDGQIVLYADDASGVAAVQAGEVDAFAATAAALRAHLRQANDPGLELATPFSDPVINGQPVTGHSGTAFRQGDAALRDIFNVELEKLKASGQLLEILLANGFDETNLPGDVTAAEICAPDGQATEP
jgi:polar amino acid transport system substrate-binding protein